MKMLGVNQNTLDRHGAVSAETATEMVLGVCKLFQTDVGISVTGIAGPGGATDDKPVGLVYIGICIKNQLTIREFRFGQNRIGNKLLSSQAALNLLRLELLNG
jgi:PncC family amidohydrolase